MSDLEDLETFLKSLLLKMGSTEKSSKGMSRLSQKIQTTLTQFQTILNDTPQKDLVETTLTTLKLQLQEAGLDHLLEEPVVRQIEHLLTALKNQNLAAIGNHLESLAAKYEESGSQPDVSILITGLKKHIPPEYFEQIAPKLQNTNPNILHQTIQEVAHKIKAEPENLDLDAVIRVFEQNLGHLIEPNKDQKEAERLAGYRSIARQSILKSLRANGIQPPNEET